MKMAKLAFQATVLRAGAERSLLVVVILATFLLGAPPQATAATDLPPNLQMAPLRDVQLETRDDGRHLLRFSAIIVNVGAGPFELHGSRAPGDTDMGTVTQRVYDTAGGSRAIATPATMFFAGDGHQHWHVRNLQFYELRPLDGQNTLGTGAKSGFCFFDGVVNDLTLPGAPQFPHFLQCGEADSLAVTMGTSVGWGDIYEWSLPDQWIDVTGLPPGRYRLRAAADPDNWFVEQNDADNDTWLDVYIGETTAYAFSAGSFLPFILVP
jgi:hypothetical protein